jgi:hypothetical protein
MPREVFRTRYSCHSVTGFASHLLIPENCPKISALIAVEFTLNICRPYMMEVDSSARMKESRPRGGQARVSSSQVVHILAPLKHASFVDQL